MSQFSQGKQFTLLPYYRFTQQIDFMFRRLINKLEWQIQSGPELTDLDSKEQIAFLTDYVKTQN